MFEGEMASLTAILKTNTVKVPKPIKVLDAPGGGSVLVMEHLDMRHLSSHAAKLGAQLADLHLDNKKHGEMLLKEAGTVGRGGRREERPFVDQFGFDVVTCCGYLPQAPGFEKRLQLYQLFHYLNHWN
ncbi:FN3KRP isoform 6, partial [Pongo abelii]